MSDNNKNYNKLQLKKQIRDLRKNIKGTINQIEHLDNDELLRVALFKRLDNLYHELETIKDTLIESGCSYPITKTELSAQKFDDDIVNIRKMVYVIEEFPTKTSSIIYNSEGDNLVIESKTNYLFNGAKERHNILTKDDFYQCLRDLKVSCWKRNYGSRSEDNNSKWSLKFFYFNQDECLKISGSDIFPYNFEEFKTRLKINI